MRDERYYQRLAQIRQKYGYLNDINPEQETRQPPYRKQSQATSSLNTSFNTYLNSYDIPQKQLPREKIDVKLDVKRQKENTSVSPILSKNIATDRSFRDKRPTYHPQEQNKYPNHDNIYSHRPSATYHPLQSEVNQNIENSSPIKMLQNQYSNPGTPRNYERPQINTPSRAGKPVGRQGNVGNYLSRTPNHPSNNLNMEGRDAQTYLKKTTERSISSLAKDRSINSLAQGLNRPSSAISKEDPYQYSMNPQRNQDVQNSGKMNFSVNSIDKIQQKIQQALNKAKR